MKIYYCFIEDNYLPMCKGTNNFVSRKKEFEHGLFRYLYAVYMNNQINYLFMQNVAKFYSKEDALKCKKQSPFPGEVYPFTIALKEEYFGYNNFNITGEE